AHRWNRHRVLHPPGAKTPEGGLDGQRSPGRTEAALRSRVFVLREHVHQDDTRGELLSSLWGDATAKSSGRSACLMGEIAKVYYCVNQACVLGSRKGYGRFTGGITAEQLNVLTGDPVEGFVEGTDYGEGF